MEKIDGRGSEGAGRRQTEAVVKKQKTELLHRLPVYVEQKEEMRDGDEVYECEF